MDNIDKLIEQKIHVALSTIIDIIVDRITTSITTRLKNTQVANLLNMNNLEI